MLFLNTRQGHSNVRSGFVKIIWGMITARASGSSHSTTIDQIFEMYFSTDRDCCSVADDYCWTTNSEIFEKRIHASRYFGFESELYVANSS